MVRLAVDGDLALFHGFEKSGLGLWAGSVDLVGEQDLREYRARPELEVVELLIECTDAGDVGGQQVGRELGAAEGAAQRARQRLRQHRLADARDALDEEVAFAK